MTAARSRGRPSFAFVVSIVSMPGIASADNGQGQTPAKKTPTAYTVYPPDVQVTAKGMIHHADTPDGYLFEVSNIGQGPAMKIDLYKETKIYRRYDNLFIKTDTFKYTHQTPLNPGEKFLVEVSCTAHGPEYCDYGSLGAVVVGGVTQDSNVANNFAKNNDESVGKPTL